MKLLFMASDGWKEEAPILSKLLRLLEMSKARVQQPNATTIIHFDTSQADKITDRLAKGMGFFVRSYPREYFERDIHDFSVRERNVNMLNRETAKGCKGGKLSMAFLFCYHGDTMYRETVVDLAGFGIPVELTMITKRKNNA